MDIHLKNEASRFKYRVGAVILHENRILLITEDRFDFWYLPGGHVTMLETSEEAIKREVQEELGEKPILDRLLWTTENLYFFAMNKVHHHDLAFYYLVNFPETSPLYKNEEGLGYEAFSEEANTLKYKWFAIDQLETIKLVPRFLPKTLKNIPSQTKHIILNELQYSSDLS